jgi:hypothetical protein
VDRPHHGQEHFVKTVRRTLIVGGALVLAYGISGALRDADVSIGVLVFLAAVLVVHDGLFLPLTIGAGALIGRLVPAGARGVVRAVAVVALAVGVVALPLLLGP